MSIYVLSQQPMKAIWSALPSELILECLLYLEPRLLARLASYGRIYHGAFLTCIQDTWEELSEWEAYIDMELPIEVKLFLSTWDESTPFYQKCVACGRGKRNIHCQLLRELELPSRNNALTALSRDGFICMSFKHIYNVHKDYEVYLGSFLDVAGQRGPVGCIVEVEFVEWDFSKNIYRDTNIYEMIGDGSRGSFYCGLGYSGDKYGITAGNFFEWLTMLSPDSNKFFYGEDPKSQDGLLLPLIWERCGGKSWMKEDKHYDHLPEIIACWQEIPTEQNIRLSSTRRIPCVYEDEVENDHHP